MLFENKSSNELNLSNWGSNNTQEKTFWTNFYSKQYFAAVYHFSVTFKCNLSLWFTSFSQMSNVSRKCSCYFGSFLCDSWLIFGTKNFSVWASIQFFGCALAYYGKNLWVSVYRSPPRPIKCVSLFSFSLIWNSGYKNNWQNKWGIKYSFVVVSV